MLRRPISRLNLSARGVVAWGSDVPGPRVLLVLLMVALIGTAVVAIGTLRVYGRWDPDRACCDHLFYRSMAHNFFTVTRPDLNEPPPGNDLNGFPTPGSISNRCH